MPSPDKMGRRFRTYVPHLLCRPCCHSFCGFCPARLRLGKQTFLLSRQSLWRTIALYEAKGFLSLGECELGKTCC